MVKRFLEDERTALEVKEHLEKERIEYLDSIQKEVSKMNFSEKENLMKFIDGMQEREKGKLNITAERLNSVNRFLYSIEEHD